MYIIRHQRANKERCMVCNIVFWKVTSFFFPVFGMKADKTRDMAVAPRL